MTNKLLKTSKLAARSIKAGTTFSEMEYRSVFDDMLSGAAYHRIITDKNNKPVDYVFLEINKAYEKLIGLDRDKVVGKRVTDLMPLVRSSTFDWINFYGAVASSGKGVKFSTCAILIDGSTSPPTVPSRDVS